MADLCLTYLLALTSAAALTCVVMLPEQNYYLACLNLFVGITNGLLAVARYR